MLLDLDVCVESCAMPVLLRLMAEADTDRKFRVVTESLLISFKSSCLRKRRRHLQEEQWRYGFVSLNVVNVSSAFDAAPSFSGLSISNSGVSTGLCADKIYSQKWWLNAFKTGDGISVCGPLEEGLLITQKVAQP
ncbi:uncharacterized protein UDID_18719 [Ustilago sp. UG-2017a]|nr:uncharacterized protein UDID_18719 [Ustilago sp. UG-2017a]